MNPIYHLRMQKYKNNHFSMMKVKPSNYGFTVIWQESRVFSSKFCSVKTFY